MLRTNGERCSCGEVHREQPMTIVNEADALRALAPVADQLAPGPIVIVYDAVTHHLFGEAVVSHVEHHRPVHTVVLGSEDEPFEPNELAVKRVVDALHAASSRVLVGVGAGAINDLGKYVAHHEQVAYIAVATAPSMDGYASPISALLIGGVKVTFATRSPDAIIADLSLLSQAPQPLVAAGFADMLGKRTSLRDWEAASVLLGEYWCASVARQVEEAVTRLDSVADALAQRSPDAVGVLMDGLLTSGAAVTFVGNSRPTSGSEHLMAHYVEMRSSNEGIAAPTHGHVVGFGTLLMSEIVQSLLARSLEDLPDEPPPAPALESVYREVGFDAVPDNFGKNKFQPDVQNEWLRVIRSRWDELATVMRRIPRPEAIRRSLERVGAPTNCADLGIERRTVWQMVMHARFMRERFTLLDVAAETGVLEQEVTRIVTEYT